MKIKENTILKPIKKTTSFLLKCKGYYCGYLGLPSGQPPDAPRMVAGHVPVVYSLHDPRGLTSSRIRLSHQSILFHNRAL